MKELNWKANYWVKTPKSIEEKIKAKIIEIIESEANLLMPYRLTEVIQMTMKELNLPNTNKSWYQIRDILYAVKEERNWMRLEHKEVE